MTKKQAIATILGNLPSNINNEKKIEYLAKRMSADNVKTFLNYYLHSGQTKEDSYFCYKIMISPFI